MSIKDKEGLLEPLEDISKDTLKEDILEKVESNNLKEEIPEIFGNNIQENFSENPEIIKETNLQENAEESIDTNIKESPEKPNNEMVTTQSNEITYTNSKEKKSKSIFATVIMIIIAILLLIFTIFTVYNIVNSNIIYGVSIKGLDVSNLSKSDAKYQVDNLITANMPEEIKLKHSDFETSISISQIGATFNTNAAATSAYNIGRQGNVFQNNLTVLNSIFGGNTNIEPTLKIDKEQLIKNLEDISTQLPDTVIQSSYYTEGNNLIITHGTAGNVVDIDATIEIIKNSILDFSCKDNPVEIAVKTQEPDAIDIEKIYNEVKKDPVDAYYTQDPFMVYPSENGMDFNISLDEAKAIVQENKEEYSIPLKIIYPNVTTNMIGTEAFPDLLSTFSTKYSTAATARTTNLRLAANKINGTVVMPGETFSYNKVVGARTIAAGYKEAPIYVQGEVVDGLGGGICQITSTLYNAVVYANLEVTQRSNHQFVPSYVTASRDATVVYGSIDFQFKNNRDYPIKLVCSVSRGIANFQIFGLKTDNEYEVQISSYVTGSSATSTYSEAYKILKQNGAVVKTELLSKDTYKRH